MNFKRTSTTTSGNPVYENESGDGHIVAIPDDGEIYIPAVFATGDANLSELVGAVVDELENNHLAFTNVINDDLKEALDGFEETQEFAEQYDEYVTVLRGEWDE